MTLKPSPRRCCDLDLKIAERLYRRRLEIGISQVELASVVGVTFQQIQKYENGRNRIAASRLFSIAQALSMPITFFFD